MSDATPRSIAAPATFTAKANRKDYTEAFNVAGGMLGSLSFAMPSGGLEFISALMQGLNHPNAQRLTVLVTTPSGTFESVVIEVED